MPDIVTDPAYASRRATDMHELARRMERLAAATSDPRLRERALSVKRDAEDAAVRFDEFVR